MDRIFEMRVDSLSSIRQVVAMTYNGGVTTNDPLFYTLDTSTDKTMVSRTVTEIANPSGTRTAANTGYCVGNRGAADRTFNGQMAYLQYWNRILSIGELNQAAFRPGSVSNGLQLFLPMHSNSGVDWSGNGRSGTVTAGAVADGPPMVQPLFAGIAGWQGNFVTAVAGGSLIKTVDGLAIASVKTVDGLAIASVKTIDGLTNV